MKEAELQNVIDSLPRGIKPPSDLWPGINRRLDTLDKADETRYKAPYWRRPARTLAMAAAVLLVLTGGIFFGRGMGTSPADQMPQSVLESALLGTAQATEREYQAAFHELVSLDYVGLRSAGEQPDALRGSWEDLQLAESSLLDALAQYPSNIYLNGKFQKLRSQQLQFVKRLALLEQHTWRKT